jgi:hypothetical protein
MRYIDRRFLLPVAAATAWAQQQPPEAAKAEAALRARAEQFFQYQVDKKYRQAESLVADDSKDSYYDGNKFNIRNFRIQKVELSDNNTQAKLTIMARVTLAAPAAGQIDFDVPSTTLWKMEDGKWVWYVDQAASVQTPFGSVKAQSVDAAPAPLAMQGKAPDVSTLLNMVKVDRDSIVLTKESPQQSVSVSNDLPGEVDLELGSDHIDGFKAEIQKKHLAGGEKTLIEFTATGEKTEARVVRVVVSPLGTELDIRVTKQ